MRQDEWKLKIMNKQLLVENDHCLHIIIGKLMLYMNITDFKDSCLAHCPTMSHSSLPKIEMLGMRKQGCGSFQSSWINLKLKKPKAGKTKSSHMPHPSCQ